MSTAKPDSGDSQAGPATGSSTTAAAQGDRPLAANEPGNRAGAAVQQSGRIMAAPPRRSRPLLALAIIAVIVASAGLGYAWYRAEHPLEDAAHLVLTGNIDVRQVNLAFKVDGRIESLAFDEGDAVTAGQVVATLDKSYFEDDLRVARAQQDFDRAERLVSPGAVSRETFDQAKAILAETEARLKVAEESERMAVIGPRVEDIDAARAQLAAEEAAILQFERRLADAELIAPSDGIILTRAREKGAIVSASETVFTLTLASPVWVRTYVNERDLGRIHPGMTAQVKTDSAPDKIYHGRIGFISPTAEFTPKAVETRELRTNLVYRLRVLVDNPDNGLRQGMPVTVVLDLDLDQRN